MSVGASSVTAFWYYNKQTFKTWMDYTECSSHWRLMYAQQYDRTALRVPVLLRGTCLMAKLPVNYKGPARCVTEVIFSKQGNKRSGFADL